MYKLLVKGTFLEIPVFFLFNIKLQIQSVTTVY